MSAIQEMKNEFNTTLDKIEIRYIEKYQELAANKNLLLENTNDVFSNFEPCCLIN